MADIIEGIDAEHEKAIIGHIVERVTIDDRAVTEVLVRMEARLPEAGGRQLATDDGFDVGQRWVRC